MSRPTTELELDYINLIQLLDLALADEIERGKLMRSTLAYVHGAAGQHFPPEPLFEEEES